MMKHNITDVPQGRRRIAAATLLAVAVIGGVVVWKTVDSSVRPSDKPEWDDDPVPGLASIEEAQISQVCSHCHLRPEPDVLPKDRWPKTIWTMVKIGGLSWNIWGKAEPEAVLDWYQQRAPDRLDLPPIKWIRDQDLCG